MSKEAINLVSHIIEDNYHQLNSKGKLYLSNEYNYN